MAVVVVIALLAMMGRATTSFMHRLLVRAELEKLYLVCQHARGCALATHTQQELQFDCAAGTYCLNGQTYKLAHGVSFGYLPGAQGPPASATKLLEAPVTFACQRIIFYPDGIIQAGTVYLVDTAKTVMYALSNAVSQFSYLRCYTYNHGWTLIA